MNAMMMQHAMCMASVFGPFLMILGIWMLFYNEGMMKVCASLRSTPCAVYVLSIINILIGLFVVTQFNVWMMGLSVLLTLFGWVALIRGIVGLFKPHVLLEVAHDKGWLKVKGIIPLVWGFGLCWFAFWMQQ